MGHLAQADSAEAELAIHRVRAAALAAARVRPHRKLRLALGLVDQSFLRHQFSLNGKPSCRNSALPSSSVVAEVTTVMSMPRGRSMVSTSISWNPDCSVSPNV